VVDEYQLTSETDGDSDSIVDATVTEETVLLRLKSGKVRLLHLVQSEEGTCFDAEDVEAKSVGQKGSRV
jgi:hypothetical protein